MSRPSDMAYATSDQALAGIPEPSPAAVAAMARRIPDRTIAEALGYAPYEGATRAKGKAKSVTREAMFTGWSEADG